MCLHSYLEEGKKKAEGTSGRNILLGQTLSIDFPKEIRNVNVLLISQSATILDFQQCFFFGTKIDIYFVIA